MTKPELQAEVNKLWDEAHLIPDADIQVPVRKWYWYFIRKLYPILRAYLSQGGTE
jgi:hypothetical protein